MRALFLLRRVLVLVSIVMLFGVACDGDSSSATAPSPTPPPAPPPEARVTIERLRAQVGLALAPSGQIQLVIAYRVRITETAGVGITLRNAQIEIFDPTGDRFANDRMTVDEAIPANGRSRLDLTWVFGVNFARTPDEIRTTYRFVDDNGYTKELVLINTETEVSGLREALSQLPPMP